VSYAELEAKAEWGEAAGRVAGIVVSLRERRSQRGNRFAFALFSEPTGQFEVVVFSEVLAQARPLLEPGAAVLITAAGERDRDRLKLGAQAIQCLDEAANGVQRGLKVVLDAGAITADAARLQALKARLTPGGKGVVSLSVALPDRGREVEITIPGRFDI